MLVQIFRIHFPLVVLNKHQQHSDYSLHPATFRRCVPSGRCCCVEDQSSGFPGRSAVVIVGRGPAVNSGWLRLRRGVCLTAMVKAYPPLQNPATTFQHPAKKTDEHIEQAKMLNKKGDSGHGRRRCRP